MNDNVKNEITVTPEVMKNTIKTLFTVKRAVAIEGPPGGGKTSICAQAAEELGVGYIEIHMPTTLVEDFGIPDVLTDEKNFGYKLPKWFPAVGRDDIPEEGILCLDDSNQASSDLQKVMANIIQARTLHTYPMKPGWMVVRTGNRVSDRAGAGRILSHLRNRETKYNLETVLKDWLNWAEAEGCHPMVTSFIQWKPDLLHAFDPTQDQSPTPRSWMEGVSPMLDLLPKETLLPTVAGAIGDGPAIEFISYQDCASELPDIKEVLKDPNTARLPERPIVMYAMMGQMVAYTEEDTLEDIITYIERWEREEFMVMFMQSIIRRKKELLNKSKVGTELVIKYHNYVI